jgi:hypothetical protein
MCSLQKRKQIKIMCANTLSFPTLEHFFSEESNRTLEKREKKQVQVKIEFKLKLCRMILMIFFFLFSFLLNRA